MSDEPGSYTVHVHQDLKPGDLVQVEVGRDWTVAAMTEIREKVAAVLPKGVHVVVSTPGTAIEVKRAQQIRDEKLLRAFRSMVADLDRCEHGRHEGDECINHHPDNRSTGNPHRYSTFGFDIGGRRWTAEWLRQLVAAADAEGAS